MIVFEAWEGNDGITFSTTENIEDQKKKGLIDKRAKLLHRVEADNYEKAMEEHYRILGWGNYKQ